MKQAIEKQQGRNIFWMGDPGSKVPSWLWVMACSRRSLGQRRPPAPI